MTVSHVTVMDIVALLNDFDSGWVQYLITSSVQSVLQENTECDLCMTNALIIYDLFLKLTRRLE